MQNTSNNQDFSHIIFFKADSAKRQEYFYRFCLVAALLQVIISHALPAVAVASILYRYSARGRNNSLCHF